MPTNAYRVWVQAGRPYVLMRPAKALKGRLQGHGYTVYDYPDEAHLEAATPEDHTPFSATGFPVDSAFGVGHALDVMPKADTAAARRELADLSRKLIHDRDNLVPGVRWIKYINWTDEHGVCRQERWMDPTNPRTRSTRSSSDKGHTHISGRSDADNDTRADTYDPYASSTQEAIIMPTNAELAAFNVDSAFYALNKRLPDYKAAPAPLPAGVTTNTVPNVMLQIEAAITTLTTMVQRLIDEPTVVVQPSDAQWAALLEHIDATLAQKVGDAARVADAEILSNALRAAYQVLNAGQLPG
jgi:hypothetical protein